MRKYLIRKQRVVVDQIECFNAIFEVSIDRNGSLPYGKRASRYVIKFGSLLLLYSIPEGGDGLIFFDVDYKGITKIIAVNTT